MGAIAGVREWLAAPDKEVGPACSGSSLVGPPWGVVRTWKKASRTSHRRAQKGIALS